MQDLDHGRGGYCCTALEAAKNSDYQSQPERKLPKPVGQLAIDLSKGS